MDEVPQEPFPEYLSKGIATNLLNRYIPYIPILRSCTTGKAKHNREKINALRLLKSFPLFLGNG